MYITVIPEQKKKSKRKRRRVKTISPDRDSLERTTFRTVSHGSSNITTTMTTFETISHEYPQRKPSKSSDKEWFTTKDVFEIPNDEPTQNLREASMINLVSNYNVSKEKGVNRGISLPKAPQEPRPKRSSSFNSRIHMHSEDFWNLNESLLLGQVRSPKELKCFLENDEWVRENWKRHSLIRYLKEMMIIFGLCLNIYTIHNQFRYRPTHNDTPNSVGRILVSWFELIIFWSWFMYGGVYIGLKRERMLSSMVNSIGYLKSFSALMGLAFLSPGALLGNVKYYIQLAKNEPYLPCCCFWKSTWTQMIFFCFLWPVFGLIGVYAKVGKCAFVGDERIYNWSLDEWVLAVGFTNQLLALQEEKLLIYARLIFTNEHSHWTPESISLFNSFENHILRFFWEKYGFRGVLYLMTADAMDYTRLLKKIDISTVPQSDSDDVNDKPLAMNSIVSVNDGSKAFPRATDLTKMNSSSI